MLSPGIEKLQKCQDMVKKGFLLGDVKQSLNKNFTALLEQETKKLEQRLILEPEKLLKKQEFVQPWYPSGKQRKTKLGSLYHCEVDEMQYLCRVVDCKRIAEYQIDAYFTQLAKYQLLKLTQFVVFPQHVSLDDQSGFLTVVEPKHKSLYQVLHEDG